MHLNGLGDTVDHHEYPIGSTNSAQRHSDEVIGLQNGQGTVAQTLARLGDEAYTCPQDVRDVLLTGARHKAVGHHYCSDRDPSPLGENEPEMVSF